MSTDEEHSLDEVMDDVLAYLMDLSANERPTYSWLLTKTFKGEWENDGLYEQGKDVPIIMGDELFDGLAALTIAAACKGLQLHFSFTSCKTVRWWSLC